MNQEVACELPRERRNIWRRVTTREAVRKAYAHQARANRMPPRMWSRNTYHNRQGEEKKEVDILQVWRWPCEVHMRFML